MRSLMIGDCDHYASPYMRGVAQAMKMLGHDHVELSIRQSAKQIEQRVRLWNPHVVWTHMLLWPPPCSPSVGQLIDIVSESRRRGAQVVIHDGDAKAATRYPHDISSWCSLALVNHGYDRSAWRVPVLRWPYFAMAQKEIAKPVDKWKCGLFFAGTIGGGVYSARSALLDALRAKGIDIKTPTPGDNTLDRTDEVAASADAVLGFGRPDVPEWIDVRVFQYIAAGAILVHDDVAGYFDPWVHYVPYESGSADSIIESLRMLARLTDVERQAIRQRGFERGQERHSSVVRVKQVLRELGL